MAFKSWFRGGGGAAPPEIDDLIVLERYEEAEGRLRARLKNQPNDLHAHLKLADVLMHTHQVAKAIDEYVFVAEEYADDGFYDKGIALLAKVQKLLPDDGTLRGRIQRLQRKKRLELSQALAIEGLLEGQGITGHAAGGAVLEFQRLWKRIEGSSLVERLDAEQLKRLFTAFHLRRASAGDVLAEQGESREEAWLLADGEVAAQARLADGRALQIRSFGPGDLIGERALLERRRWPARYQAVTEVTALGLGRQGLEKSLAGNPDPRAFLDVLRSQGHDREVEQTIGRMGGRSPAPA